MYSRCGDVNGDKDSIVIGFSTAPNEEVARALGEKLVREGLAACVNVVPGIRSIYVWKGEIVEDRETLMIIKTRRDLVDRVRQVFEKEHPYEVPELIFVDVVLGHKPYIEWVIESTKDKGG